MSLGNLFVATLFFAAPTVALPLEPTRPSATEAAAQATIAHLLEAHVSRNRNLEEQEEAWPSREQDQLNERPAPINVRKLQAAHRVLLREIERLQSRLEKETDDDVGPILTALKESNDVTLFAVFVPLAAKVGREDARTPETLIEIARRIDPCPISIVNALGDLGNEEASLFLLVRGLKERSLALLKAAGKSGERAVIKRLIDLAEGKDERLAKLCLRAITSLTPPTQYSGRRIKTLVDKRLETLGSDEPEVRAIASLQAPSLYNRELQRAVSARIKKASYPELQTALVVYLGLFRNPTNLPFLVSLYVESNNEHVRLSVLGALGNLGAQTGDFILSELSRPGNSLTLQKGCIGALGSARYRPAAPILIDLLTDQQLEYYALRALKRIAGENLGHRRAVWLRWWNIQPESLLAGKDPDDA
jgi:HEAT repeat protein